jgi:hypothetical protein
VSLRKAVATFLEIRPWATASLVLTNSTELEAEDGGIGEGESVTARWVEDFLAGSARSAILSESAAHPQNSRLSATIRTARPPIKGMGGN